MVAGIAAKLTDAVGEGVSRIVREDAIDRESVTGERVDDVVAHDSHVFERKKQTPRTVPHAWRSVGSVVVVDSVVRN